MTNAKGDYRSGIPGKTGVQTTSVDQWSVPLFFPKSLICSPLLCFRSSRKTGVQISPQEIEKPPTSLKKTFGCLYGRKQKGGTDQGIWEKQGYRSIDLYLVFHKNKGTDHLPDQWSVPPVFSNSLICTWVFLFGDVRKTGVQISHHILLTKPV